MSAEDEVTQVRDLEKELKDEREQQLSERRAAAQPTTDNDGPNVPVVQRAYSRWTRLTRGTVTEINPKSRKVLLTVDTPFGERKTSLKHTGWNEESELARLLTRKGLGAEVGELYNKQILLVEDSNATHTYSVYQPRGLDGISKLSFAGAYLMRHFGMAVREWDATDSIGERLYMLSICTLLIGMVAGVGVDAIGVLGLLLPFVLMIGTRLASIGIATAYHKANAWANRDRIVDSG